MISVNVFITSSLAEVKYSLKGELKLLPGIWFKATHTMNYGAKGKKAKMTPHP